jgi:transposase-like protein
MENPKPTGRPSKFRPEFVEQARKLCALYATNAEIADFFGVHLNTLDNWRDEYPELDAAMAEAKEKADAAVERSLYQRAVGYDRTVEKVAAGVGVVKVEEHFPASDVACIFWLKNRRPDKWRDKQEVALSGGGLSLHIHHRGELPDEPRVVEGSAVVVEKRPGLTIKRSNGKTNGASGNGSGHD